MSFYAHEICHGYPMGKRCNEFTIRPSGLCESCESHRNADEAEWEAAWYEKQEKKRGVAKDRDRI